MPTTASHVWRPSAARVIILDAFVPVPRGTAPIIPPPLSWPVKDPDDVLDYQFDIAPALIGNDGDVISTLDVTISPSNTGDLVLNSATADGTKAILWLSAGQAGTTYTVNIHIATEAGRAIARSILLPVSALAVQPDPNAGSSGANGTPAVTQVDSSVTIGP